MGPFFLKLSGFTAIFLLKTLVPFRWTVTFYDGRFEGLIYSTDLKENKHMIGRDKIQIDLIKLVSGERILRLTEPQSGLSLEKKVSPAEPVVRQKKQLRQAFEAALSRIDLAAA